MDNSRFKFRVFDLRENKYLDIPAYITQDGNLVDKTLEESWFDGGYIREMSIGKQDKNGNLLYEGDIVFDNYSDDYGIIEFDEDEAKFGIRFDNVFYDFSNAFDLELYGNIHENKDLLEEEK